MLIYHPAYDIYHTSFRILAIMSETTSDCLDTERVRMYDFLLLFPHELHNVRLPVGSTDIRRKFRETKYNRLPNRRKVYNQLRTYFDLSAQCLISYGALDIEKYQNGELCKAAKFKSIVEQFDVINSSLNSELLQYFQTIFSKIATEDLKSRFK